MADSAGTTSLGIDLGTTYTAAAIVRNGRAEIVTLGNRAAAIPSLVFLRDDESILVGEAAERRGIGEPTRLAREFKRRVGDTTPIVLGPSPYSAERLSAQLLRWVIDTVAEREGATPAAIAVAHPANWGEYKVDLMRQAVSLAGVGNAVFITEPVAAAVHYATTERIQVGDTIAVYDLGGGTFDAAVLRRTEDGFAVLGRPEGIERLGGIDFDDAIIEYVRRSLGDRARELEGDDETTRAVQSRLRHECMRAKEGLSTDTDTTIHVPLAAGGVDLRLTRSEFETMIRPPIRETINVLVRAIESAGVTPADLKSVLLVGGSSRIPLVSELVAAELGRPVAVDVHPKHSVALGAALFADRSHGGGASVPPPPPVVAGDAGEPPPPTPPKTKKEKPPKEPKPPKVKPEKVKPEKTPRSKAPLLVGLLALVLVAAGAAAVFALGGDDGGGETAEEADDDTGDDDGTGDDVEEEPCEADGGLCAYIDDISIADDAYVITYATDGFEPLQLENGGTDADHHVHFFFNDISVDQAGTNAAEDIRGTWVAWDLPSGDGEYIYNEVSVGEEGDAGAMCIGVADSFHGIDMSFSDCVDFPGE